MPIDHKDYIRQVLRKHPFDVFDLIASVLTTFIYRYIKRCADKNVILRRNTKIINYGNVHIGNGSIFQDNIYLRAGTDGYITFGKGCMVNSFCRFFGHGGIEIGDYSQIGPGVTLTTTEHDYHQQNMSEQFEKIQIGTRVWLGANVTVLPGVKIGDHTIVGAGSLVKNDLPPNSLAVGVPAKVIKSFGEMAVNELS